MKANANIVLYGKKVVLVPYESKHVPKYHEWMKSEELRTLTASEPLTLEEEFEMQRKWREDEDKLTFILLSLDEGGSPNFSESEAITPQDSRLDSLPMIGDVNLFLKGTPPLLKPPESIRLEEDDEDSFEAEIEIMIAEPRYRRKGCALEALQLMLSYATQDSIPPPAPLPPLPIQPESLVARVSDSNIPSIKLLEKLGFRVTKHVAVFSEIELRWKARQA
ncbi:hypothetical protein BDN72DRAFT_824024 [Pluteus cervinus]|uniref:Uncharacterized protein n=1 Tax=Pluteus cervinus TaxID=181527 RepID=A0ACD3AJN8_9AGAR|nr:hypothetical protein BDN72DRAFT_824024 [Pluteus cervinus]